MEHMSKSQFMALMRLAITLFEKNCSTMGAGARTDEGKKAAAMDAALRLNFTEHDDVREVIAKSIITVTLHSVDVLLIMTEIERSWEAVLSKRMII